MGSIDDIWEMLDLIGPEHGNHGMSGGEIFINTAWDDIQSLILCAEEVQAYIAVRQIIRQLQKRTEGNVRDIGTGQSPAQKGVALIQPPKQDEIPVGMERAANNRGARSRSADMAPPSPKWVPPDQAGGEGG